MRAIGFAAPLAIVAVLSGAFAPMGVSARQLAARPAPAFDPSQPLVQLKQPVAEPLAPDVAINAVVRALSDNDAAALFEALPDSPARSTWPETWSGLQQVAASEQAERQQKGKGSLPPDIYLSKLQTDEGVDSLVDELEALLMPKLPDLLLRANVALERLRGSSTPEGAESDIAAQVQRVGQALQSWLDSVDFADRDRLRKAVVPIAEVARKYKIDGVYATSALSLEELIAAGGELIAAMKRSLGAYGIDPDPFLASMHAGAHTRVDNRAEYELTMTLFGETLKVPMQSYLVDGKWINEHEYQARNAKSANGINAPAEGGPGAR